jgi:uncharacterized radical SAM superfamily Fe-S cluster-containing enzyme
MIRRLSLVSQPVDPVAAISSQLKELDAEGAARLVDARDVDRALKSTVSLCPECLGHVPALVFERGGRVILAKKCGAHGASEALIESDAAWYRVSNKDRIGRRFADEPRSDIPDYPGACCGPGASCGPSAKSAGESKRPADWAADQDANRTCTVLVEVTDACNLQCRVCYSDSKGTGFLPLEAFQRQIRELLAKKGMLESVQVTGGESTLHPQFWELIAFLHGEPGVRKIYVPTNGLTFARADMVKNARRFADKLMVLLQFDALDRDANQALRAADPSRARRAVVDALDAAGVALQLTMTLSQDVNDDEVGAVIDVGLRHKMVKVIALQPATWSGRYQLAFDPMRRLTLSDVAKAVLSQAKARISESDFAPVPCSHPNCGWITVFWRRFGLVQNIMRFIDLEKVMGKVAYKAMLTTNELQEVVGSTGSPVERLLGAVGKKLVRSTDMLSIGIKPFMDRYTYDQDRVANCCHHMTDTHGRLLSFCEYNARLRQADSWARFPTREQVQTTMTSGPGVLA